MHDPHLVPTLFSMRRIELLLVLVFWIAVLFASFALLAPGNTTVVVTLFIAQVALPWAMLSSHTAARVRSIHWCPR